MTLILFVPCQVAVVGSKALWSFPYFSSLCPSTSPDGITPEAILMGTALTQGTVPWLHTLKACLDF